MIEAQTGWYRQTAAALKRPLTAPSAPKLLAEYVGQPQVRSQMEIFIQAAKLRGDALRSPADFWPAG